MQVIILFQATVTKNPPGIYDCQKTSWVYLSFGVEIQVQAVIITQS